MTMNSSSLRWWRAGYSPGPRSRTGVVQKPELKLKICLVTIVHLFQSSETPNFNLRTSYKEQGPCKDLSLGASQALRPPLAMNFRFDQILKIGMIE